MEIDEIQRGLMVDDFESFARRYTNVNRETLYNRALSIVSLGSVMREDYDKKSN